MPTPGNPLSFAQQRLWFLDQLNPELPLYNIPLVFDLDGPLNPDTLRRALEELVRRHEPLRTVFPADAGVPRQHVLPDQPFNLGIEDLSALSPADAAAALDAAIDREVTQPFDLRSGPILRTTVVRMTAATHVLIVVVHHISFDGWSSGVFFRELAALYGAFAQGQPSPLPDLPMRYVDFAVQQREWLTGDSCARQIAHWCEQLRPPRPNLALPADRSRPAIPTFRGNRAESILPEAVMTALQETSRREGVTLFMTLLAAYGLLLHRLTGQDDVVIGTPIANRTRQDLEPLVGFFANTLPLRLDLDGRPTVRELLARTKQVALSAYANQDLPFERLVEELNPERRLNQTPILQTLLVVDNPYAVGQVIAAGDIVMRRRRATTRTAKFDVSVFVRRAATGRLVAFETSADLFDQSTSDRMARHFCRLLEALPGYLDERLDRVVLGDRSDRQQIATDWNQTTAPYPVERTLVDLFEAQASLTPEADAVLCGHERLSYAALDARADALARVLRDRGIGADDRVGVCLHRSPSLVVAVLAVLKAGGAYVPIDPAYPRDRVRFIASDAGCRLMITEPSLQPLASVTGCNLLLVDSASGEINSSDEGASRDAARPDSLAYVIYTSGSTGTPKGVAIEHRQVVNLVSWALATFSPAERTGMLASTSISFDLSVFELFVPLCSGGVVILVDNLLALPSAPARERVTFVNSVPSVVRELLETGSLPRGVTVVAMAGEALHPSLVARVYAEPSVVKVFDLYGPTETTVYATCALRSLDGPATIGRPIANTTALVLDAERAIVPVGVAGELYLGGAGVGRGYLGREDLTRERFVIDPAEGVATGRMYRTGDRVRWRADGSLEFLGRLDRQVKIRGFRIELGEIEAALQDHPDISEAVLLKRDSPEGPQLVAFLVERRDCDEETLYRHLEPRLPHYMLPSAIVRLPAIPRLPNGKLDYGALEAIERPVRHTAAVAPRSAIEERIAAIWRRVLNLPYVGVEDHFFRIGGHSLLAAQVVGRLQRSFGVDLEVDAIFRAPTIARLATVVEQHAGTGIRDDADSADRPAEDGAPIDWSGRATPYPRDSAVTTLFEERVRLAPDAPAVVGDAGTLTYAQLNERANRLARYLRSRLAAMTADPFANGPVPIGVCLERSVDVVVALLAILKAGGAYVPLDATHPSARLGTLAANARLRLIVTRAALRSRFRDDIAIVELDTERRAIDTETAADVPDPPRPDALAYVLFTSGTTGEPKAVGVPHRAIVRLAYGLPEVRVGPGETVVHLAPLSFDASTFEIWCPLLSGGCIAVAPEHVATSSGIERFIAEHRVSVMWLTASLFNTLVDDEPAALNGLKCLLTGGEALSVPHVQRALAALPGVRLINGYGPTETTTFACCHPIAPDEIAGASSVPIGRPLANTRVYVLDADGRMIRPGEAGELWIGGDGVAIGYLNDPQLTALRFTEDPFVPDPEARMYRSGDRARFRSDGTLEFLGRLDDQIKIRGFRIEPGEVEAAIARHPDVARVAVVAADLPTVGRTLVAFVVLSASAPEDRRSQLLPHGLREELRARLPEFMVPAIWMGLDALPLTASGKIDRRALALLAGERRPAERPALPSQAETEREITRIWQTVLGVEAPNADANFFFLGGHSLLATQVLSRIETALGVPIDLRTFFSRPTVSGLAAAVRRSSSNGGRFDTIPAVSRDRDLPLSYAQQRIWFLQRWYGNSGVYNVPMAVRLDGPVDLDALTTALEIVVHRHESLRTVFPVVGKEPVQRVLHEHRLDVQRVDLSDLDPDAATAAAQAEADAETHRPFDLEHELPIRATILRLSAETSVLLLTLHHIVSDGWSLEILFREISVLYAEARCRTTATSLQPLPIQYPDFAAWQRRYLMGDVLEGHLSYWRKQLHPPLPALELRPDRERPAESTARGERVTFDTGEAIAREASRFSLDEGVTLFMTLLAAYQAVLHRYTGQQDMCVGTPVANRTRPEIEGLIGCFINTLVMRADLSGNPSFRSLLRRTSETAIDAQAHQDLPFELLVDALQVTRSANRSPLFQAMFALQDGPAGLPSFDGVTVTRMRVPFDYAKFEWTLHVRTSANGIGGALEYNADLFDRTTADAFVRDFTTLLGMALAEPDRALSDFPLEGADARHRYQHSAPDETVRVEEPATASGLLERAAAIEQQLEPLWREVLGVTRVDVHDNFFDLGGNSLVAIRLFAMLEDCFGTKLPLSTLFGGGTIESQARLLAAGAMNAESASPLVSIQPLGTRPPFFLVHGIGGEVLVFAALAKHLGLDQPIFGLRAGRYESIDENETIEAVATRYIAAMRERSPEGPYLLGGYSSGGIIAFEMAQQLRAAGEDVALLVMLDGPAPHSGGRALTPSTVWHMVKNVASWPLDDQFFKQGWAAQRARLRAKVKSLRMRTRHGGTTAALAAGADVRALLGLWGMSDDATRFVQHHLGMRVRYQPRAYDGVVTVFRARTLRLGYRGAPDLGWSRLARGGVTLHSIPGAHDTILKEPRVQKLAAILGDSLRDAQRGPATGVEDRLAEPSKLTHS